MAKVSFSENHLRTSNTQKVTFDTPSLKGITFSKIGLDKGIEIMIPSLDGPTAFAHPAGE